MIRTRTKPAIKPEAVRLFSIGQTVSLKSFFTTPLQADETYQVTACLPQRNDEFQYRIRAEAERHERVAGETSLELVEAAMPATRKD